MTLNEREAYLAAKARIEKEEFFCRDWDLWMACAELKQVEIDKLEAELEKAKAQAVPEQLINEIQSWIAVKSFSVEDANPDLPIIDANELAEFIDQLVKGESGAEG